MVAHLMDIASEVVSILIAEPSGTEARSHLDIGSNDATLLKQVRLICHDEGIQIDQLGIDPSGEGFKDYYDDLELKVALFDYELAELLNRKFDVITSIAMFYDLPDPLNFMLGIKKSLVTSGIWISEQSYFHRMIEKNAFDTICQEHIEYYSISDVQNLCSKTGLKLVDVKFNEVNGGSFRFYVCHEEFVAEKSTALMAAIELEKEVNKRDSIIKMFKEVEQIKLQILDFLTDCKNKDLVVHGYGASTKGNTLLQYFGIDSELLPYIAERNEQKFGKFTPGTLIPIISEEESRKMNPYAYLVLPWHFRDAILKRESEYRQLSSVKFCFPLPQWQVI
jgi:hypothetical protein